MNGLIEPRDAGDVAYIGKQQESLSSYQEKQLVDLLNRKIAEMASKSNREIQRIAQTDSPDGAIYRGILACQKDKENEEDGILKTVAKFGINVTKYLAKQALMLILGIADFKFKTTMIELGMDWAKTDSWSEAWELFKNNHGVAYAPDVALENGMPTSALKDDIVRTNLSGEKAAELITPHDSKILANIVEKNGIDPKTINDQLVDFKLTKGWTTNGVDFVTQIPENVNRSDYKNTYSIVMNLNNDQNTSIPVNRENMGSSLYNKLFKVGYASDIIRKDNPWFPHNHAWFRSTVNDAMGLKYGYIPGEFDYVHPNEKVGVRSLFSEPLTPPPLKQNRFDENFKDSNTNGEPITTTDSSAPKGPGLADANNVPTKPQESKYDKIGDREKKRLKRIAKDYTPSEAEIPGNINDYYNAYSGNLVVDSNDGKIRYQVTPSDMPKLLEMSKRGAFKDENEVHALHRILKPHGNKGINFDDMAELTQSYYNIMKNPNLTRANKKAAVEALFQRLTSDNFLAGWGGYSNVGNVRVADKIDLNADPYYSNYLANKLASGALAAAAGVGTAFVNPYLGAAVAPASYLVSHAGIRKINDWRFKKRFRNRK